MTHAGKVKRLVEEGILVCPKTKEHLHFVQGENDGLKLVSLPSGMMYRFHNASVPILLVNDQINYEEYANASSKMSEEYRGECVRRRKSWLGRVYSVFSSDYRSAFARQAFESTFDELSEDGVALAVGGGQYERIRFCSI